jgi:hypothetical protein
MSKNGKAFVSSFMVNEKAKCPLQVYDHSYAWNIIYGKALVHLTLFHEYPEQMDRHEQLIVALCRYSLRTVYSPILLIVDPFEYCLSSLRGYRMSHTAYDCYDKHFSNDVELRDTGAADGVLYIRDFTRYPMGP